MATTMRRPSAEARQPQPGVEGENLKRDVSRWGLPWASEGSVIGTGWLFGVLLALTIAGPAALIGWVIGSILVIVIGLVNAELGGMFPVSGGGGLFPRYAFGSLAGASRWSTSATSSRFARTWSSPYCPQARTRNEAPSSHLMPRKAGR
jgi:amino acid transporter